MPAFSKFSFKNLFKNNPFRNNSEAETLRLLVEGTPNEQLTAEDLLSNHLFKFVGRNLKIEYQDKQTGKPKTTSLHLLLPLPKREVERLNAFGEAFAQLLVNIRAGKLAQGGSVESLFITIFLRKCIDESRRISTLKYGIVNPSNEDDPLAAAQPVFERINEEYRKIDKASVQGNLELFRKANIRCYTLVTLKNSGFSYEEILALTQQGFFYDSDIKRTVWLHRELNLSSDELEAVTGNWATEAVLRTTAFNCRQKFLKMFADEPSPSQTHEK